MSERLERWLELTHYRAEQVEDIVEAYRSGPLKGEPSREEIRRNVRRYNLGLLCYCVLGMIGFWFLKDLWRRWTGRENKP